MKTPPLHYQKGSVPASEIPEGLKEIADVVGVAAALQLAHAKGGLRIYIPKTVKGSDLAKTIGDEAAQKMFEVFGHGNIDVPMGPARGAGGRREVVRRVLAEGGSAEQAAIAGDVHVRTVWRVKADMRDSGPETLPLFGDGNSES